jgi:hypothetical protein
VVVDALSSETTSELQTRPYRLSKRQTPTITPRHYIYNRSQAPSIKSRQDKPTSGRTEEQDPPLGSVPAASTPLPRRANPANISSSHLTANISSPTTSCETRSCTTTPRADLARHNNALTAPTQRAPSLSACLNIRSGSAPARSAPLSTW